MNLLFCSVGGFVELINNFKKSLHKDSKIIATSNSNTAPALYFADKQYVVPNVTDKEYIPIILDICVNNGIKAVMTLIDHEIEILAANKEKFKEIGVEVLTPDLETAIVCYDKYKMYEHLKQNGIKTITTYKDFDDFSKDYEEKKCVFPLFVKPRTGNGSIGARKIDNYDELKTICNREHDLIIQEFMDGVESDVDVYIDTISGKVVSIFAKEKLAKTIGGTLKGISFKDEKLYTAVEKVASKFKFCGPTDMEFFYQNGEYYLSEINPRFSAAYGHAYECGVDFIKLIMNNLAGRENTGEVGNYEEAVLMMKYWNVVVKKKTELASSY